MQLIGALMLTESQKVCNVLTNFSNSTACRTPSECVEVLAVMAYCS